MLKERIETGGEAATTRQLRIASIEELEQLSLKHGWDASYTQLGASIGEGTYLESDFDSILVTRTVYPAPVSVMSSIPPGYAAIGLHLSAFPARIKGVATSSDRLFVGFPGVDYELITQGVGEGFTIVMPRHEIESKLGDSFSILEKAMSRDLYYSTRLDAAKLDSLKRWYRQWIANSLSRNEAGLVTAQNSPDDELAETLSHLLDSIEPESITLRKNAGGPGKIAELIDYFHAFPDQEATLDTMMRLAGMRRRTLFNLFKEYTGYTPYQYFIKLRLGFVRRELMTDSEAITDLALKYNFNHLGEFSALYKNVYGELPSETRKKVHPVIDPRNRATADSVVLAFANNR